MAKLFVGFHPNVKDTAFNSVVKGLVRRARKLGWQVLVPIGSSQGLLKCGAIPVELQSLVGTDGVFCAVIVDPINWLSEPMPALLQQVANAKLGRYAFIMKPLRDRLVPEVVFTTLRQNRFDVCNAIHSAGELMRALEPMVVEPVAQ